MDELALPALLKDVETVPAGNSNVCSGAFCRPVAIAAYQSTD
ncbi:hypothetical protein [Burkholderia sp. D-99]|nr:hypothetical protein [Burkholderia sp. D-99]